jgi:hypothetical protein
MAMVKTTLASLMFGALAANAAENDFYQLTSIPFPVELKLEISGMAALPDDRMALAIRKGEIWIAEKLSSGKPTFRQFASGLHEPLGLAYREGDLYTVQRSELTRLRDTDGDGRADEYLAHAKGWGVTGNYHEYAYGPAIDGQGNLWLALNCTIGNGPFLDNRWRGWSVRVEANGNWSPMSGGFRSPSGIGTNLSGDVFVTDQQGNWFPTCPLIHVKSGVFHGHADALQFCRLPRATFAVEGDLPKGLTVVEAAARIPAYRLPAVWFPYRKMGMSTTDILADSTRGRFGPFAGQLFVGEFTMSFVSRVFLEKVGGEYQGACFRFRDGLDCAALRLEWSADGSMFIGESNRGWNSLGSRSYGLQRLRWTGKTPFEILRMESLHDGFRLVFSIRVNRKTATEPGSYRLSSYTYPYHQAYGGAETDTRQLAITATKFQRTADGKDAVRLTVDDLQEGFVHELSARGVRSQKNSFPLLHPDAFYTLNKIRPAENK